MNTTKDSVINERHQKMLVYQKDKSCPPTLRDLEKLWGLYSTSAVSYVLQKMEEKGKVVRLPRGKYNQYVAVENENGNSN